MKLGYVAIKLHPRFGNFSYSEVALDLIITAASQHGLTTLLCTYCWSDCRAAQANNTEALMGLLSRLGGTRIILLHGGGVKLLEFVEIARAFPNVLLDLSYVLCKFSGSSIDLDLEYAFSKFDRRICVGSDSPEIEPRQLRESFTRFSYGLSREKAENIAFKNIFNFLPLVASLDA